MFLFQFAVSRFSLAECFQDRLSSQSFEASRAAVLEADAGSSAFRTCCCQMDPKSGKKMFMPGRASRLEKRHLRLASGVGCGIWTRERRKRGLGRGAPGVSLGEQRLMMGEDQSRPMLKKIEYCIFHRAPANAKLAGRLACGDTARKSKEGDGAWGWRWWGMRLMDESDMAARKQSSHICRHQQLRLQGGAVDSKKAGDSGCGACG
jgi:hypothetical protein